MKRSMRVLTVHTVMYCLEKRAIVILLIISGLALVQNLGGTPLRLLHANTTILCTIRLQPVSFCNQGHDIMWISRTECVHSVRSTVHYYCPFWDPDHDVGSEHMEWAPHNAGSGLILSQKRTAWTQNVILMACFSPHAPSV